MIKILITGTSGQLGEAVASNLAGEYDVMGLDIVEGKYTTHVVNITDREKIFTLVKQVDTVIHTASLHAPHVQDYSKTEFVNINIRGTLNLLEACIEHGVRRFIYSSTTSLYGNAMESDKAAVWVTETLVPQPRDIYDVTKTTAENLCRIISQEEGLRCISLRVSRFFEEPFEQMAIYRLYRGVDVRDAADAHILALHDNGEGYDVFNISAKTPFTEKETEELYNDAKSVILRHFPHVEDSFSRLGWQLPNSIDRVYVIEKAERCLGYQPRYNFREFIENMNCPKKG